MATKAHKLLTGTDLHEPKGVAAAPAGQVYVSDGAGSGVWTTISLSIGFSTGDIKLTYKTVADSGWIIYTNGQTIGSDTSTADFANTVLYGQLYLAIWNSCSNTAAPVAGGRGGSAAADLAANKKMTLPPIHGRALGVAGAGTSLTVRAIGDIIGNETVTLTAAQIPAHTHPNTLFDPGHIHATNATRSDGSTSDITPGSVISAGTAATVSSNTTGITITNAANTGGGGSHNNMQPTAFMNVMVKL